MGEILEVNFGNFRYNLAIINFKGNPAAVFVTYSEIDGKWIGMGIPHVLRKFPELLEQFTQALYKNGFMLLTTRMA
jgi:hypothetical protein